MESNHLTTNDVPDSDEELFSQDGVMAKSSSLSAKTVDVVGVLSVVYHKSKLGKCIEWNQSDVSIESDDQEWAIVRDSKFNVGNLNDSSKNYKTPVIQIPLKSLLSFRVCNRNTLQLSVHDAEKTEKVLFYFPHGQLKPFISFLTRILNTSRLKNDQNLYIVRDQSEVQTLEKSFVQLDLFSDDNTKSVAVWSFIKKLQESPYETTLSAFSKVTHLTDVFLYPLQSQEMDNFADVLNKSLASDELPDNLVEDYELISKAIPDLPTRILPPRRSPLTLDCWLRHFDEEGKIFEEDKIKEIIFHGGVSFDSELRCEVWKFLLNYYPWNSTYEERKIIKQKKEEQYQTMKFQWKSMTAIQEDNFADFRFKKGLIEKDVCRTDRNMPFFEGDNNPNLEKLHDILMTYVMYNFDLGYVQGMSDLLSPLLLQLNDEVDTFWCFVGFMNKVYRNFDMDQAGMKKQLHQLYCILLFIEPELARYLENQESHNMAFCFRWLLVWFKREFSYENIFVLWEVLWTEALCKNFHLLICAAILDTEKRKIMSNNYGFTEILKHVNELAENINLDLTLQKAEGMYYQCSNATEIPAKIKEILGLDSQSDHTTDKIKESKIE